MPALVREAIAAAKARSSADATSGRLGGAGGSDLRALRSLEPDEISGAFEAKFRAMLDGTQPEPGASGLSGLSKSAMPVAAPPTPAPSAGDMMSRALGKIDAPLQAAESLPVDVLQGRVTSPAEIAATIKRADLTFRYSLEIRNRLLDAYREVMRMGV